MPFGSLPEGAMEPFRFINYIVLEKDPAAGRDLDSYIVTQQVFNPDGTFSLLHYGGWRDVAGMPAGWGLENFINLMREDGTVVENGPDQYYLPLYKMEGDNTLVSRMNADHNWSYIDGVFRNYVLEGKFIVWPEVQTLVEEWLTTGHMPERMENIILLSNLNMWKPRW
jgi:uncharacterized protein YbdZ (MbtH family)